MKRKIALFTLSLGILTSLHAEESTSTKKKKVKDEESSFQTALTGGYGYYSGVTDESLAGLTGYNVSLFREHNSGFFRLALGAEYSLTRGSTSLATTSTYVDLQLLTLKAGTSLYFSETADLAPFISAMGFASRGSLRLPSQPAGYGYYSRPNFYGYELGIGVDIQRAARALFRIKVSYLDYIPISSAPPLRSQQFRFEIGI